MRRQRGPDRAARRQGIGPSATIRGRPQEVDARTIENTELARAREEARRDADRYQGVGGLAATALVDLLMLMTAAIVAIFVWFGDGLGDKFGFASGVFGLLSGLITYVVAEVCGAGLSSGPLAEAIERTWSNGTASCPPSMTMCWPVICSRPSTATTARAMSSGRARRARARPEQPR